MCQWCECQLWRFYCNYVHVCCERTELCVYVIRVNKTAKSTHLTGCNRGMHHHCNLSNGQILHHHLSHTYAMPLLSSLSSIPFYGIRSLNQLRTFLSRSSWSIQLSSAPVSLPEICTVLAHTDSVLLCPANSVYQSVLWCCQNALHGFRHLAVVIRWYEPFVMWCDDVKNCANTSSFK